jgi:long-subunit fatty acid transport protein
MRLLLKITGLVLIITAMVINAQDFNDALRLSEPGFLSSPRALGMGNAYTALSNDFSASLFNPAGFAFVKRTEFSGSVDYNSFANSTTFFNRQTDYSNNTTDLNQAGFVLPFPTTQGSFALAIGYNQIKKFDHAVKFSGYNPNNNSMIQDLTSGNDDIAFQLGLSYPLYNNQNNYLYDTTLISGRLNQSGNIINSGALNKWNLSGAIEFQKDFFIGVSISRISGDFRREREYLEDDVNNNYPMSLQLDPDYPETADFRTFYFNDIIRWDISAWDFTLGLIAKLDDNLNFGFTYRLPRTFTIKETYYVDANADFGTGKQYYLDPPIDNQVEYKISTPNEFSAGLAYNIYNVTLSFDAKLIDYTQMEFENGSDLSVTKVSNNNSDIKDLFRTVLNLNAGFEYIFPQIGLALRGGFMLMPSPFKDDPSDYDKKIITAGIGFETNKNISFNLGYAYGWWKDFGDNYGSNVSRTFQDITHNNLVMGIKYYF